MNKVRRMVLGFTVGVNISLANTQSQYLSVFSLGDQILQRGPSQSLARRK